MTAILAGLVAAGCSSGSTGGASTTTSVSSPTAAPVLAATSGLIAPPSALSIDASGAIYFTDSAQCIVRRWSAGTISPEAGIAGGKGCGGGGDGRALQQMLNLPSGLAIGQGGELLIADFGNCVIRKVSAGMVKTIAGKGTHLCVFTAPDGPATSVAIYPQAVAAGADGSVYIADWANCRVWRLSGATLTSVAGVGEGKLKGCGSSGDGGPATAAELNNPISVAVDASGAVFVGDASCRVRVVRDGIITPFAGTGAGAPTACGSTGDDGPATAAGIGTPAGIAVNGAGDLFIADAQNCVVRKVSHGVITTIAGSAISGASGCGYGGDDGPATSARFNHPAAVAVDTAGNVYIADTANCRIRKVAAGIVTTVVGGSACAVH